MKIFKIIGKGILGLVLFTFICIAGVYIYGIATQYRGGDIEIPDDFFHTKNHELADVVETDQNGLEDFLSYMQGFSKQGKAIGAYDSKYKCKNAERENSNSCRKYEEILEEDFGGNELILQKKMKNYFSLNKLKSNKFQQKDFISLTEQYSGIIDPDIVSSDTSGTIIYSPLIQYTRALSGLAHEYFAEGKTEKALNIVLSHQETINYLEEKFDADLIGNLTLITIDRINSNTLKELVEKALIDQEQTSQIKEIIEKEHHVGLVDNGLKHNYKKFLYGMANIDKIIETELKANASLVKIFFSIKETKNIHARTYYELITKKAEIEKDWSLVNDLPFNLSNYFGRLMLQGSFASYSSQYAKEKALDELKKEILELLN